MITKDQELKLLRKTLESWPEHSYLYRPLSGLIHYCEMEMKSDFEPDLVSCLQDLKNRIRDHEEKREKLEKTIVELEEKEKKLSQAIRSHEVILRDIREKALRITRDV